MYFPVVYILLLALSEPLLIHAKKLVLMIPREIRRSPAVPHRFSPMRYKKYGNNEIHYHTSNHPYVHRSRKPPPFSSSPLFPHGGDDFDGDHENVNHVSIPYGKGISHAITFGKGYIPYENIKNNFPSEQEKYIALLAQKQKELDYSASSLPPSGYGAMSSSYRSSQTHAGDSYPHESISTPEYLSNDRRNEENKFYAQRSIGNELAGKVEHKAANTAFVADKNPAFSDTEFFREGFAGQGQSPETRQRMEGAIILPAGIPPSTIGGSKQGVILRDTVALDDYKRTVNEMTKSWPASLGVNLPSVPASYNPGIQQYQTAGHFPMGNYQSSVFQNTPVGWGADFAQPKQGYDVKEDISEPAHDFRTTPIQTSYQQHLPNGLGLSIPTFQQPIHG